MREILFRGKRLDNGEWAFGFFTKSPSGNTYIAETVAGSASPKKVIPETVGQYTGLKDRNGKKIFEGDILDTPDRLVVVTWLSGNAQFDCDFIKYAHDITITNFKGIFPRDFRLYEIIGNIHNNPEFLKGGAEC